MAMNYMIPSATVLLITGVVSADFIGFDGTFTTNAQGNNVAQMYAVFDNADAVVVAALNMDARLCGVSSSEFIHNDVQIGTGGTWNPAASLDIPNFSDSSNDSYVTIGYGVGADAATNGTVLDLIFGEINGDGPTFPSGFGWYNGTPLNEQGVSSFAGGFAGISGYAAMIGQFVWNGTAPLDFRGEIAFNTGSGTDLVFDQDVFLCPTPGALALFGLGGLATRRRRG